MVCRRIVARLSQVPELTRGAIDLASIMTGVLVMAVIGGVISASVSVVIPWAQDSAAQSNLAAVVQAQGVERGLGNQFTSKPAALKLRSGIGIKSDGRTCYGGFSTSATGKVYYLSSQSRTVNQIASPWPIAAPQDYPVSCLWPMNVADATDVDLAPPLSVWSIQNVAGNSYNAETGELTLALGMGAVSPLIPIPLKSTFSVRADGRQPADVPGANAITFGIVYYAADGVTKVKNLQGYDSNGEAIQQAVPTQWNRSEAVHIGGRRGSTSYAAVPETAEFVRVVLSANSTFSQGGMSYRNPSVTIVKQ